MAGKVLKASRKIDPFSDPAIRDFFSSSDPEVVYADLREIGHGGFGSVYYVSTRTGLFASLLACVSSQGRAGCLFDQSLVAKFLSNSLALLTNESSFVRTWKYFFGFSLRLLWCNQCRWSLLQLLCLYCCCEKNHSFTGSSAVCFHERLVSCVVMRRSSCDCFVDGPCACLLTGRALFRRAWTSRAGS